MKDSQITFLSRIVQSLALCACMVGILYVNVPSAYAAQTQTLDRIVAKVNHNIVTASELNQRTHYLMQMLQKSQENPPPKNLVKRQMLNKIVFELLQTQLAKETGLEIDEASLDSALLNIAKRDSMSLSQLKKTLENQGMPYKKFRENVRKEMLLAQLQQREVGSHITVSKTDVDNFLNSPAGLDQSGTEYHLKHILLTLPKNPTPHKLQIIQDKAEKITQKLKAGADFSKLAMTYSQDQQALQGGDLGWRKLNALPTLFVQHMGGMQTNEILGPIRSVNGFHIIQLKGKRIQKGKLITETKVRQILIKTGPKKSDNDAQAQLGRLRIKIEKGAPFEKLAKKYSEELSSSEYGGSLGWVTRDSVVPAFYKQMKTLKKEALSQPFKTNLGWHLIEVLDRRTQQKVSRTEHNKARQLLFERKFEEALMLWLNRLKEEAEIKLYL